MLTYLTAGPHHLLWNIYKLELCYKMLLNCCQDALNFQTIAGNETTLTMRNIGSDHIYAISLNTPRGSSGLSLGPNNRWLCLFDYNGKVSAPESISSKEISSRSLILTWTPPKCEERFTGRVLHFEIKQRTNTSSGEYVHSVSDFPDRRQLLLF